MSIRFAAPFLLLVTAAAAQAQLSVTPTSLPNGIAGKPYSQALTPSGGTAPYLWTGSSLSGVGAAGLTFTDGQISGTPTTAGPVTVSITLADSSTPTPLTLTTSGGFTVYAQVAITTTTLPNGTVNSAYDQVLTASGGAGTYTWTGNVTGTGSAGLTLTAAGHVSGTPTSAGLVTVSATVADASDSSNTATRSLNFSIGLPVAIGTTTLPNGVVNKPYDQTLAATGGSGSYTWSGTVSGAGSAGLSLSAAGHIIGTPTAAGLVNVSATVADSSNLSDTSSKSLSFVVYAPVAITTTTLPSTVVGEVYDQTLSATGGAGTYTWTGTVTGAGAAGLSLNAAGHVIGTPTAAGAVSVAATATDSANAGNSATKTLNFTVGSGVTITTASLPNGVANSSYDQPLNASGGSGTYTWSGSLSGTGSAGLSLTTAGHVFGTPTSIGPVTVSATATDTANSANVGSKTLNFTVYVGVAITTTTLPNAAVNKPYDEALAATGGAGTYTWSGSLSGTGSAGLSLTVAGHVTGTPTTAGAVTISATVADSANPANTTSKTLNLTVQTAVSITTTTLPNGVVNKSYDQALAASGGSGTYTWSGTLSGAGSPGLSVTAAGHVTGTPTTAGPVTVAATVTDNANSANTATKNVNITVFTAVAITTTALSDGVVNVAYDQTLAASGGSGTYTWSGSLSGTGAAGLSLNAAGHVTGTPSSGGTVNVSATVADTANPGNTASKSLSFAINTGVSITTASLPDAVVGKPYSQTLTAAGGSGTYTWTGSLSGAGSAGLSFTGGQITGTPTTAGSVSLSASVSDTAVPPNTAGPKTLSFAVHPALAITTTSLPNPMVGAAYDQPLVATGGTGTYAWSGTVSGAGSAGLSFNGAGHVVGTPTTTGAVSVSATVTDNSTPPQTATANLSTTVNPPTLTVTSTALADAAVGTPYSQALTASGGAPPYSWSGTPPAGLAVAAAGTLSGTPTAAGTFNITVHVTDSQSRGADGTVSLRIFPAVNITACPTGSATVNRSYSSSSTATGGATPYTWSLASGQLPAGIQLNQSSGLFSGTPTQGGNFSFAVKANDPTGSTATRPCTLTVASLPTIPRQTLADAVVGTPYSQTLNASGGVTPYIWSLVNGPLPPGILLDPSGVISGTPTQTGQFPVRVSVLDANASEAQSNVTLTVSSGLSVTACPTAVGAVGQSYSSPFSTAGGPSPFSWAISAGALPAGLTLDASTGTVRGTPTAEGTSTFTGKVTDSTQTTATRQCSIQITATLNITTTSLTAANVGVAYTAVLSAAGGTQPYTWSLPAGSLPPGLSLNAATGQITGTPTNAGSFGFTARVTDAANATRDVDLTIAVTSTFAIAACPTAAATIGVSYASSLNAVSGQSPYGWSISAGGLPAGLALNGVTGVITGTPSAAGTANFTVQAKDAGGAVATRACNISVVAGNLSITTGADLPQAAASVPYSQTLAAGGGQPPYTWSVIDGTLPPGLQLSSDGALAGTPTASGAFTFTIRVVDAAQSESQEVFHLTVAPASVPTISFPGVPDIAAPAQQISPAVQLDTAYPVDITGTMTVSFTPDPGLVDDPAIQFAGGGRSVPFTIPAGQTQAVFANGANGLQTGTVAGTLQLKVAMQASGVDVTPAASTKSFRVDRLAPQITSVTITTNSGGFQLQVTGYSTTREVTQGTFVFTPAPGSSLTQPSVTVQMTSAAQTWFSSSESAGFGSQFLLTMPFTLQGATLSSVSVTLTNGQGTSPAVSASF